MPSQLDKGELELWLRNPITVLLRDRLRAKFPDRAYREIHSTEPQPVLQLGRTQGKAEVVEFVLSNQWAGE